MRSFLVIFSFKFNLFLLYELKNNCYYRFETDNPLLRFSEAQLAEIRKATLAKILCENMDVPSDLQKAAFDQPNDYL